MSMERGGVSTLLIRSTSTCSARHRTGKTHLSFHPCTITHTPARHFPSVLRLYGTPRCVMAGAVRDETWQGRLRRVRANGFRGVDFKFTLLEVCTILRCPLCPLHPLSGLGCYIAPTLSLSVRGSDNSCCYCRRHRVLLCT